MLQRSFALASVLFLACGADPAAKPSPARTVTERETSAPPASSGDTAPSPEDRLESDASAGPREPAPAAASKAALSPDAQALLTAHNARRASHCAPPLRWSDAIARVAQRWADELVARGCAFDHSRGAYGENLAAGSASIMGPEAAVTMWYDEIARYDFGRPRFAMDTGHVTQVLWKATTELGCGSNECNGMRIWVCNYAPAGNVMGEFAENVLPRTCARPDR